MDYRPHRINLDGVSKTETRVSAAAILPGSAIKIVDNKFVQAAAADIGATQLYVANVARLQGLGALDAIPAGDSIEGEYLDNARRLALLGKAAEAWTKDAALTIGATGLFELDALAAAPVAWAQEDFTIPATGNQLALGQVI